MLLGISFYLLPLLTAAASAKHFTNGWSVQISSKSEAEAERVAREINSIMKGEVLCWSSYKFEATKLKNSATTYGPSPILLG